MKKLFFVLVIAFMLISVGCGDCKKTEKAECAKDQTVKEKTFKHYSLEQFLNTISIGGRSFTHDESKILFSSNKTGISNIFAVPVTGGDAVQLTDSTKESYYLISAFPNDERILFMHDAGGNEIYHIYVREKDGSIKDLTPEPQARALFAGWSRDLKSFYYSSNKRDKKFLDLYQMDIDSYESSLLFKNEQAFTGALVSKDKRYIALNKTDTRNDSDVYLYDTKTKELKNITAHEGDISNSPNSFSNDSKTLYIQTDKDHEFAYIISYDLETGNTAEVIKRNWGISFMSFSWNENYRVVGVNNDGRTVLEILDRKNNKTVEINGLPAGDVKGVLFSRSEKLMAFYLGSSRSPNNLYIYDIAKGTFQKLTDSINPEMDIDHLAKAEVVRYKSFDGMTIPGIYYKPLTVKKDEKIPALVWVHGGPGGQSRIGYSSMLQYLVNHGYAVLAVNNRGSSGYGKTFFQADDRKHGEADLMDCVYAKKFFKSTGYIDENKIGIIGGSYGGYMVLAALAYQPEEFNVGVDIFGVSNWVRTLKSIPPWWEAIRKSLYIELGNPETDLEYLKKISPLFHADKITKPLMVLQGANDPRVLKVESDEIVAAVKKKGIPCEYLVLEDEGHGFRKKKNQIKAYKAVLRFLDKHLKKKDETYIY